MSLSVGIVGLPNVGKSTLFNALLKKQAAYVANFPFATIEPNIGVVPVGDDRLAVLSRVVRESENLAFFPPEIPATVKFIDIAGLISGAHRGEGLGNKFLAHIREVNTICHVVRNFKSENTVREGSTNPKSDLEVIETELALADLQTIEKQPTFEDVRKGKKDLNDPIILKAKLVDKLKSSLEKNIMARDVEITDEEKKFLKELNLLTSKPILVALNSDEADLKHADKLEDDFAKETGLLKSQIVVICAKTESELTELSADEQKEYLKNLGVYSSSLDRLVKKGFETLGLQSFLTAGEKEVRAWTIEKGSTALRASGEIHTDFMDKFIKADVVGYEDFVGCGGWKNCREKGLVRSEGKDYLVKDGDVIEFKIGS
jgi:ribosome-binding ATPase